MQYTDAVLSVTHPGLHFILSHSGGCARFAGLPPASVLSPTSWAQNSSGFQPDKVNLSGSFLKLWDTCAPVPAGAANLDRFAPGVYDAAV